MFWKREFSLENKSGTNESATEVDNTVSSYHVDDDKMLAHSQSLPQIKGVEKHKAQGNLSSAEKYKNIPSRTSQWEDIGSIGEEKTTTKRTGKYRSMWAKQCDERVYESQTR